MTDNNSHLSAFTVPLSERCNPANRTLDETKPPLYNKSAKEVFSMKSIFEQMGGTYTKQGDYYLPDLKLPPEEERPIGIWGQRRLRYLREHRPILYTNLKTTGQLRSHLADVEEQANALFLRLVKDYAASEGVTEQLKAQELMEWVRRMNGIRARVTEVVNSEVIIHSLF